MFSVVIPAYNEEKTINKCLDSLVRQKTNTPFEVIVVDNNSTDGTQKVVKEFQNRLNPPIRRVNLKLITENKKGRGAARATGFKVAKGEIIFSTDADTQVSESWLERLSSYFKDKNTVVVTGPVKIKNCSFFFNCFYNFFEPILSFIYHLIFGHFLFVGSNCAVRKTAYLKINGFDRRLTSMEDVDLGFQLRKIGKIKFARGISVITSGRRFENKPFAGILFYFKEFFQYFFFNKESYLNNKR